MCIAWNGQTIATSSAENSFKKTGEPTGKSKIATDTPEQNKMAADTKPCKPIKVSYHQGQAMFSAESRGHQCVAMEALAARYAAKKNIED